jgi:hypothetical protein
MKKRNIYKEILFFFFITFTNIFLFFLVEILLSLFPKESSLEEVL